MFHEVETLKVCVKIDSHSPSAVSLFFGAYHLLFPSSGPRWFVLMEDAQKGFAPPECFVSRNYQQMKLSLAPASLAQVRGFFPQAVHIIGEGMRKSSSSIRFRSAANSS